LSDDNPFRVLGVPVQFAMMLTPKDLRQFVKELYRALQRIQHPDHGGSTEQSQRVNQAMKALEDETLFMMSWHEFVSNPDPLAGERIKEIGNLRRDVRGLREGRAELERKLRESEAEAASLRSEVRMLKAQARENLESFLHKRGKEPEAPAALEGMEIEYAPLRARKAGSGKETVTAYVIGDSLYRLNDKGGESRMGRMIGTISLKDYRRLCRPGEGSRFPTFGLKAKEELATSLTLEITPGRALVCQESKHGDAMTILGRIVQIRPTTLAAAKMRIEEETADAKRFRQFYSKNIRMNPDELGLYAPYFNGIIRFAEPDERVLVVKHGSARCYGSTESGMPFGKLAGCVDAAAAESFLSTLESLAEKDRRKAVIDFMIGDASSAGALSGSIAAGRRLIMAKNDLPFFEGMIGVVETVDVNMLAVNFDGILSLRQGQSVENLISTEGELRRPDNPLRINRGKIIGSKVELFNGTDHPQIITVPWVIGSGTLAYKMDDREKAGEILSAVPFQKLSRKAKKDLIDEAKKPRPVRLPSI
jgi:hypothetical protein